MQSIFKAVNDWWNPVKVKVVVLGLDAAGKTTMIYKLKSKFGEVVTTIPTIGFNVETVEISNTELICWDVGGCDKIRPLWRHFTKDAKAVVYVVDSNDRDRLDDGFNELYPFFKEDDLLTVPLLVFANKQDLPNAMTVQEIIAKSKLGEFRDRKWLVQASVMTTGIGIREGFSWLRSVLANEKPEGQKHPTAVEVIPARSCDEHFAAETNTTGAAVSSNSKSTNGAVKFLKNYQIPEPTTDEPLSVMQELARKERQAYANVYRREDVIASWLRRCDDESEYADSEAFLRAAEECTLDSWDHYTHVRLGFELFRKFGITSKAFSEIERVIVNFILNSKNTNGRSFNCTMTRFWAHMIGIIYVGATGTKEVSGSNENNAQVDDKLDFRAFLKHLSSLFPSGNIETGNDYLDITDGKLFQKYYSNPTIFSATARQEVVPPDLQTLPLLAVDEKPSDYA
jgi:ADP-ribosylation factor protein 1